MFSSWLLYLIYLKTSLIVISVIYEWFPNKCYKKKPHHITWDQLYLLVVYFQIGSTALFHACLRGHVKAAKRLICDPRINLRLLRVSHWKASSYSLYSHSVFFSRLIKFIYSEKATKFCEIFTLLLSYVVPVRRFCKILWPSQNIWTLEWR